MNINDAFPSKYLKASDVPDDGDLILTIRQVDVEEVGQGDDREQKPIVYFGEIEKGLVLNKTNANAIQSLYGADTAAWEMKRIAIFATEVDFKGTQTLALRVRLRPPAKAGKAEPVGAGAGKAALFEGKDD